MGIQLPGELAGLLKELGLNWPQADEQKLYELGKAWLEFSDTTKQAAEDATAAVGNLPDTNDGTAMAAFWAQWDKGDSVTAALNRAVTGGTVIGGALFICAAVVLVLKIQVILQLVQLEIKIAQAVAAAAGTFGGSLAAIPIYKKTTQVVINALINKAVGAILGG